ncbi:hypothetical protein CEXT_672531 [Caerostris extrusa]|uniref:SET domain-containing protein n=1 Tax=Caerostris extrusa TaxID=172846 RepID=A0AAV4N9Y1_CAEEX|nr:hypothetical protein CEXT_672531 [Caerostris extrusa]
MLCWSTKTTPEGQEISPSNPVHRLLEHQGAGLGVWTEMPLVAGVVFGPYKGKVVKKGGAGVKESGYAWQVRRETKTSLYVEGGGRRELQLDAVRELRRQRGVAERGGLPVQGRHLLQDLQAGAALHGDPGVVRERVRLPPGHRRQAEKAPPSPE